MAENTVAILGGAGMLGTDLAVICRQHNINVRIYDLPEFDITNNEHLEKVVADSAAVINCAAYTNVEKAEDQQDLAYSVNAEAVGQLGTLAKKHNLWVLHVSTDFVFDGKSKKPYCETDKPNPINVYGQTKLDGENLLVKSNCNHCILRIEWTYGFNGNNFVTKLVNAAKNNKELKIVDDQRGSPTATTEVAKVICTLLKSQPLNFFHFAAAGYTSRLEMARFVFDKLGISVNLRSCKTSDYISAAKRPLNSCFNCDKIQALLDEPIKPWQIPLENFLRQL